MTALIEEGGDLVDELERDGAGNLESLNNDAEDFSDPNWQPDPMDAPPDFHLNRTNDIIQMLVSIYDSKDVFIKEFQVLLAQSLLAITDYNAERQIRNVEILKRRFGEAALQGCEIMLKDLADSKRADQNVHTVAEQNPLHPTIMSRLFWPPLQASAVKLPEKMAALLTSYQTTFANLKPDKKLRWLPAMGTVEIEVELDDRTLQMAVSPVQAAVVELFQESRMSLAF
jgi:anaphase-promoting complex subunit 2